MRKIKFRGKRIDNSKHERKEFVYGSMLYLNTYDYDCYGNCKRNKKEEKYFIVGEDDINIVVDRDTIGQYIDLKDWDEKEVFEGDIIQYLYDGYDDNDQYIVEWDEENLQYSFKNTKKSEYMALEDMYDCEYGKYSIRVIGNIYDNPNLIKE